MNIFLLFSLLFCVSVAKEEIPFSLQQLLEDNPDLIKLIEKRLGSENQGKGDQNPPDDSDVEVENEEKYATESPFSNKEDPVPNDKNPTGLITKNNNERECVPKVRMSSIIRSNASLKNGAKFLSKVERRSDADCRQLCCESPRCNLAVYENKENNNCYLFDCGNPSKCRFAQNQEYVAYEYSYIADEQQSHEDELDVLEKPRPKQKTPVPVPQTLAPTTQKPQAIALFGSCYWGDVCSDINAMCIHSQCRCKQGFYEQNGVCIYTTCSKGMFECKIKESSMCLQDSKLCNGVQDCDDGMDERNCPTSGSVKTEAVLSESQQAKISEHNIHRTGQDIPEKLKLKQKAPVGIQTNVGSQNRDSAIKNRPAHLYSQTSAYGNKFSSSQSGINYNNDQRLHNAGQPSFNQYWSGPQQLGGTGYYNQQNYGNGRTGSGLYDASGRPQQDQWGYIDYKAYPGGYNRIHVPSNSNPQRQDINSLYNSGGRMLNPPHSISDIDYNQDTALRNHGSLNQNLGIMGNGRGIDINYNRNNPILITSGHTPSAVPQIVKTTSTTPEPTTTTTTSTTQSTTTTTITTTTTTPKPTTPMKTHQKQPSQPHSESDDGFFPSWGNHIVDNEQNVDSFGQNDRKHTKQSYKHTKINKIQNGYNIDNDYMSGHKSDRNRQRNGGQRKYPTHRTNAGTRKQYQYGSYGNGLPYKYNDYNGYQGNYPAWSDYDGDYLYRDVDYNDPRIPANKPAPKYEYDYQQQRGPPARHDGKKPLPHLGKPVHLQTDIQSKPDEPVINKVPQTAAPNVIKSTPVPVTPGIVKTNTEKPQIPKPAKVDTSKTKNTTTSNNTKKQETKVSVDNKDTAKKINSTSKVKAEEVPDKGDNSIAEESNGKVIVASMTNDAQGPIVALSLGLAITLMLLIFVGCRLRTVKKRIRRGKALHSNEADYLINGMYL